MCYLYDMSEVMIMLTTKTRKQGNSIIVTLPADENYPLETQCEYYVTYTDHGTIILTPKIEDPFLVAEEGAYYEADLWADIPLAGEELI